MYSQCIQILSSVKMTECKVTGWRLIDELLLMKHWKASDDEWGVCLYVFDWIWLQMLRSDIGSSPGADNITNEKWHHLEYLHLFWQHGSPATEGDIGKVTDYGGWTCKYKEDLSFVASLSGMKLRLVMMKFHKCCCINTNDKYFYFSHSQSVFPCNRLLCDVKMRLTANLSLLRNEPAVNFSDCCPWHLTWTE